MINIPSFYLRFRAYLSFFLPLVSLCAAGAGDMVIFEDRRQNGWKDYSWATVTLSDATVHTGTQSYRVACMGYEGFYLSRTPFNPQLYQSLSFWINGGTQGGQTLQVKARLGNLVQGKVLLPPPEANTWTQVTIHLADLGVGNNGDFSGFWIQNTTAGQLADFFVDDIRLIAAPLPALVQLNVNAGASIRVIDERIYGTNLALWDWHLASQSSANLLQSMDSRFMRFPGGTLSNNYDWHRNRGVYENRVVPDSSPQWINSAVTFARVTEARGAQAIVTTNYGSGTPEQAAAWVAYYNGAPGDTRTLGTDSKGRNWFTVGHWAGMRAASPLPVDDGYNFLRAEHPAPFNFKYWEVGNECYGEWSYDSHGDPGSGLAGAKYDAVTYATAFAVFYEKMRAVDPTLRIGAVVATGQDSFSRGSTVVTNPNESTNATHSGWTPIMLTTLKTLNVAPDFLAHHSYPQNPSYNSDPSDGDECDATLLQAPAAIIWDAADLRKQITDYLGPVTGAAIELAITELDSVSSNPGKQSTSLVNGLFMADSIGTIARTEFNACNWWAFRNGPPLVGNTADWLYGWRTFGDYGVVADGSIAGTPVDTPFPAYYAAKLVSHWGRGGDSVLATTSSSGALSAHAALLADGKIALLVINKSPDTDLAAQINLTGFVPGSSSASLWRYGKPNDILGTDLSTSVVAGVSGQTLHTFPAYSMSVLQFAAPTFGGWSSQRFTPAESNLPAVSGPTADPDHDGLPNLLEYALDTDPRVSSGSAPTSLATATTSAATTHLTLSFKQPLALRDVLYRVEVSDDLQTWRSGADYVVRMDDGTTDQAVYRDLTPLGTSPRRWMRLAVTVP